MPADRTSSIRSVRVLRELNTDDLLKAVGLSGATLWRPLRRLFDAPSSLLATRLAAFDEAVGQGRGPLAAGAFLKGLGTKIDFSGSPLTSGPRLFVANHPGLGDFLALYSVLDQPELRIVAREHPFLQALPGLASRLFLVPETGAWGVLRQVAKHLEAGGAVLTFPAGRIEPDPAWRDPLPSTLAWSDSTLLWARTVPGLLVQPALIAGVRHRDFVDPWWARLQRPLHRDWTAAIAQLAGQVLWRRPRGRVAVAFGKPIERRDLAEQGRAPLSAELERLAREVYRD